jgi:peptidoglycan/xylan/chitin deacetylase (PgdA/CDA1 family)
MTNTPTGSGKTPPVPSPTPEWIWNEPGEVIVPILIYHHIAEKVPTSRYFISPDIFDSQMRALQRWGYTSIPLSLLVEALTEGAFLPPRPVVITFDDGYREVYTYAYPIMQRYGFTGTVYVIAGSIGVGKYMNARQLRQLARAGWEIGSHGWTHTSLRSQSVNLAREIEESRQKLEELVDSSVETFAFPYGLTSKYVTGLVKDAGYRAAVGLGGSFRHTKKTRYYLSRIEVRSNYDMQEFKALLPWAGDLRDEGHPSNDEMRGIDGK